MNLLDRTTQAVSESNIPASPGLAPTTSRIQTPRLVVVGPNTMSGQLLSVHLGSDAPQLWESIDLGRFEEQSVVVIDGSIGTQHPGIGLFVSALVARSVGVVVAFCDGSDLVKAQWIEFGAHGLVGVTDSLDRLGEIIRRVRSGETILGVSVREGLLSQLRQSRTKSSQQTSNFVNLTKREATVLRQLARGLTPEEVAKANFVSLNTVRTQIRGILGKLSASSVVGAVAMAYRSGWISADL